MNDLVVTEGERGGGVGSELLGHAEALARKRGCFRMVLVTAGWREVAIAFYARKGWSNYGEWFDQPSADDVAPSGQPVDDD